MKINENQIRIEKLILEFENNKNFERALKQKKYLKNKFEFLGIMKNQRSDLEKNFISEYKQELSFEIIEAMKILHNLEFREYSYTAQNLGLKNVRKFEFKDILEIMKLTEINSWWENTDGYNMIIKRWLKENPEYIETFTDEFGKSDNMWLRRSSIICQLGLKENTNFEALKKVILYNINDEEFFIQKATGWALRDYSKSNPLIVEKFFNEHETKLSSLALREGKKYLNK